MAAERVVSPPHTDPAAKVNDPAWAWAAYEPDGRRPWTLSLAAHLYRRAAFGANWNQLQQALAKGPQATVEKFLRPDADIEAFSRLYDDMDTAAGSSAAADTLRAWWLRRMIETPHPLLEKMTLFWHSHFATSNVKVKSAQLMLQQLRLLREHALGQFEPLLDGISRDPAMLVWLDASENRRAMPNENYARELLGQFSLGVGHFRESDIREAARALTGRFVLNNRYRYIAREHDTRTKKLLGQEGLLGGDDVVRIVLEQPATSQSIVRKLYRWLICETHEPSDALIAPLAESFGKDYNVGKIVETMLRSNLFFSPAAYRKRIKSPVEFALGIVVALEERVSTTQLGQDLAALGQNLFHPPTSRGWEGGRAWINRSTLIGRNNLAAALLDGSEEYGGKLQPAAVAAKHGQGAFDKAGPFLFDLFLQGDIGADVRQAMLKENAATGGGSTQSIRHLAHAIVTSPEFQLA